MDLFLKIRSMFIAWYLRSRGARVGKNFLAAGPVEILLRDGASLRNLEIGENVTLGGKVYIRIRKDGRIILADGIRTGTDVWLVSANAAELRIGKNTILSSYSIFNGGHGLKVGSYCIFAAFVYINSSDHGFQKGELIQKQQFFGAPIEIGDDVWLGGHVFVNKGVRIGRGAVIGAGAVVTDDIPEDAIAVGVPARVIRRRE